MSALPVTVDFESKAIAQRPKYPPAATSVAIVEPGKKGRYLAWGHPSGNNCTKRDAQRILQVVWKNGGGVNFHNGKFDQEVALESLGLPMLPEDKAHDTSFLAFLENPDRANLKLEQVAVAELGMRS